MAYLLVFFQKNPKTRSKIIGILFIGEDGNIYCDNGTTQRVYEASLVTPENHVLVSKSEEFLKELARQSKVSQITYLYTDNVDLVQEWWDLLRGE